MNNNVWQFIITSYNLGPIYYHESQSMTVYHYGS